MQIRMLHYDSFLIAFIYQTFISIIHNFINFLDNLDFISYSTTAL